MSTPKQPPAGRPASPLRRAEKVKRVRPADGLPTLAEARRRLAAWRSKPPPYLAPEVLDAAPDVPELVGPATYRKPRRTL